MKHDIGLRPHAFGLGEGNPERRRDPAAAAVHVHELNPSPRDVRAQMRHEAPDDTAPHHNHTISRPDPAIPRRVEGGLHVGREHGAGRWESVGKLGHRLRVDTDPALMRVQTEHRAPRLLTVDDLAHQAVAVLDRERERPLLVRAAHALELGRGHVAVKHERLGATTDASEQRAKSNLPWLRRGHIQRTQFPNTRARDPKRSGGTRGGVHGRTVSSFPVRERRRPVSSSFVVESSIARIDDYLGKLPGGVHAYPTAQVKFSIIETWIDGHDVRKLATAVPEAVRGILTDNLPVTRWVSEVHATTIYLALRELFFRSDDAFVADALQRNARLLTRPMYRILLHMVSAERAAKGAAIAFSQMHRGISLEVDPKGDRWTVSLHHPAHLVPELLARCYATALRAALEVKGYDSVQSTLLTADPALTEFEVRLETSQSRPRTASESPPSEAESQL